MSMLEDMLPCQRLGCLIGGFDTPVEDFGDPVRGCDEGF